MNQSKAKIKVTLYFPQEVIEEIKRESARQERSLSWLMLIAWRMSRHKLLTQPGLDDILDEVDHEN